MATGESLVDIHLRLGFYEVISARREKVHFYVWLPISAMPIYGYRESFESNLRL